MSTQSALMFQAHRLSFINVMVCLEQEGVAFAAMPQALGLCTRDFNRSALAAAAAAWEIHGGPVGAGERLNAMNAAGAQRLAHRLANLSNIFQIMEQVGGGTIRPAHWRAVGTTRPAFAENCYQVATTVLPLAAREGLLCVQQYYEPDLLDPLDTCLRAAGHDPQAPRLYRKAGFESRADFEARYHAVREKIVRPPAPGNP